MNTPTTQAVTDAMQKLIDDFAFEAGKSAIGVIQGVDSRSPEGVILKQGFNRAQAALESAIAQSRAQDAPVAEGAILQRMKYHPRPAEPEIGMLHDDFDLYDMDIECANCIDVLIVRADALAASPTPPASGGSSDHLVPCAGGGVTQWQPIETAPKGISVLVNVVRKVFPEKGKVFQSAHEDGEWTWEGVKLENSHFAVTHWMPLPPPPAPRPDAPTGQIKELSSNGGREGV